jgi:hypothetical protein
VPIVEELAGEPNSEDGAPDALGPGSATSLV